MVNKEREREGFRVGFQFSVGSPLHTRYLLVEFRFLECLAARRNWLGKEDGIDRHRETLRTGALPSVCISSSAHSTAPVYQV